MKLSLAEGLINEIGGLRENNPKRTAGEILAALNSPERIAARNYIVLAEDLIDAIVAILFHEQKAEAEPKPNDEKLGTMFGGALIRVGKNEYQWADGTPEPRCSDWSPSRQYNFACETFGDGKTFVRVPKDAIRLEPEVLGWIAKGATAGKYFGDHKKRFISVPVEDWDAWAEDNPYGASWDAEHEASIIATAKKYTAGLPPRMVSPGFVETQSPDGSKVREQIDVPSSDN